MYIIKYNLMYNVYNVIKEEPAKAGGYLITRRCSERSSHFMHLLYKCNKEGPTKRRDALLPANGRRDPQMSITRKAYAKINLGLDVLGKRDDGYHEVRMIMQTSEFLIALI